MPLCDHQKGVGRRLAMWRLSDRACGPRVRRSLTDGKELRCLASEKKWPQGWTGYEIGGWRDGTSLLLASSTSIACSKLPSSLAKLVSSFSIRISFSPNSLLFLEFFFFLFIRLGLHGTLFLSFYGNSCQRNGVDLSAAARNGTTYNDQKNILNKGFSGICGSFCPLQLRLPCGHPTVTVR